MEREIQETSFREIYERNVERIYRICYCYVNTRADAEDLTQETFVRLLRSGMEFSSREHESAWLHVTASNLCKDHLRSWWKRRRSGREVWEADAVTDPPETAHADRTAVQEAIRQLPERYRVPLYLYYYEGRSTAEIAALLFRKESTVRNQLRRARILLRKELGETYEDYENGIVHSI